MLVINHITLNTSHPLDSQYQITFISDHEKKKAVDYFTSLSYLWYTSTTTTTKSLQSCLTLCNPIDGSPLGSPVPGILQARTLGWVAISFSNA